MKQRTKEGIDECRGMCDVCTMYHKWLAKVEEHKHFSTTLYSRGAVSTVHMYVFMIVYLCLYVGKLLSSIKLNEPELSIDYEKYSNLRRFKSNINDL